MAKREPPAKTIRILCFGDSLTAGYSAMGAIHHPYEEKLVQMVEMAFPEYQVESVEDGVSGDLVTTRRGTFLPRMKGHCMLLLPLEYPEYSSTGVIL
jgi:lysophospholipase L1-like esterase